MLSRYRRRTSITYSKGNLRRTSVSRVSIASDEHRGDTNQATARKMKSRTPLNDDFQACHDVHDCDELFSSVRAFSRFASSLDAELCRLEAVVRNGQGFGEKDGGRGRLGRSHGACEQA